MAEQGDTEQVGVDVHEAARLRDFEGWMADWQAAGLPLDPTGNVA